MSWLWRLILTIYHLGLVALGGIMISTASGNPGVINGINSWLSNPWDRIWAGAVGGLLLVLGIMLIIFTLKREVPEAVLVKDGLAGQIFITIPAVEQIVLKSARALPGVRETRPVINSSRLGLKIYLHLLIAPDAVVPELITSLQQMVKDDVEHFVGVPVLEVKVLVDDSEAKRERK
ncbi:MAG: alkaline shock response membrane anchor protein AmaP [Methanomassiliicoccales archaeon]